jgi:hypothetical protein
MSVIVINLKKIFFEIQKGKTEPKPSSNTSVSSLINRLNKTSSESNDVAKPSKPSQTPAKHQPLSKATSDSNKQQQDVPDTPAMKKTLRQKLLGDKLVSPNASSEEEEIVVSKEKLTTKLTRDKHKKIDNQTTQIVEERYVMTPDKKRTIQRTVEVTDSGSDDSAEVAQISQAQQKGVSLKLLKRAYAPFGFLNLALDS